MLFNYFKIAFRNLARNRAVSIINILGLTLGLTCCMLIFLYMSDELSFDQFHKNKHQIYRVTAHMQSATEDRKMGISNTPLGPAFKKQIPGVKDYVRVRTERIVAKKGNEPINQELLSVDSNFLRVFSFPLVSGDIHSALNDPRSIVLTEPMAKKYFNTTDVIGKTIEVKFGDQFQTKQITAVARQVPENSSVRFEMLVPYTDTDNSWIGFYMNTFLVLEPGASVPAIDTQMNRVFAIEAKDELERAKREFDFSAKISFGLQPLLNIHMNAGYDTINGLSKGSKPVYSYILSGIALFILAIACINFVNLTIAHSLKRAKEIGVRKVMGGQRKQLIAQFLGESTVLSLLAFLLAIVCTVLVLPLFNVLANKELSLSYLLNAQLIAGYISLFLLTSLLAGFYPALVLSGFNPVQTLYKRSTASRKNLLTRGLVIFQFSLATFLIVTTVVVYTQYNYLTSTPLGYNPKDLVVVDLGWGIRKELAGVFRNELSGQPAIESVAAKNYGENVTMGKVDGNKVEFAYVRVDEQFLPTLQVPLVAGRNFSAQYPSDSTHSVVINQAFARKVGWKDPIGQELDLFWANRKMKVIGVVQDYHFESLKVSIMPQVFTTDPGFTQGQIWARTKPGQASAAVDAIRNTFKKLRPFYPFDYSFKEDLNRSDYEEEARWKQIVGLSALITIFISCIGLFGLTTLAIEKRVKEIGVRKVLGANVQGIVFLITRHFVALVLLAFLIAAPVAWYVNQSWLQNFPYRINMYWWIFAIAGSAALLLAILTVSFQAIKAAIANPVASLRTE